MFPHLQGTIKLKSVSRLLGRTPHLQARSAQAESPVCRHIFTFPIVATLTPHHGFEGRAYDGILGLNYPNKSFSGAIPIFDKLKNQGAFAEPAFAFYLSK